MWSLSEKKERYVFKIKLNTEVFTELYGIITQCHFLLHLTLYIVKPYFDILMVRTKKLNNFKKNKTFTLLEDLYFQEQLERFQTRFTVYKFNPMCTGTFTFMPVNKIWLCDPLRNPLHNCPAHHQFEVNLVSWSLQISERELT